MTQWSRSIFLAAAILAVVLCGVAIFIANDRAVLSELRQHGIAKSEAYFTNALRMKGDALRRALEDYSSWDAMNRYVAQPNRTWARNNIDSILGTYQADGYWVYDPAGKLVASLYRGQQGEQEHRDFPGALPALRGESLKPQQFYCRTGDGILEVYCSSMHATADTRRSGKVHGYFLFARKVGPSFLQELSNFTSWPVEMATDDDLRDAHSNVDGLVHIQRVLADHSGKPVALLKTSTPLPALSRLEEHHRLQAVSGLAFVVVFSCGLLLMLRYQHTLRRVAQNLDEAQQLAKVGSWERDIATGAGFWSANSYRLFGLTPGHTPPSIEEVMQLISPNDRERVRDVISNAMQNGQNYEVEFQLAHDPAARIFRVAGTALQSDTGAPARLVGTVQDITERVQQELAKDQLLRQKELFISRLSHDIKTPLTPLVALLPQIRRRVTDEKLIHLLDLCLENVNLMKSLVVKTIKLARFSTPGQSSQNARTSLALAEQVEDYLRKRTDILLQARFTTEIAIDPAITVMADQLELEEVFYNLVSNAVKYSPVGSHLAITATSDGQLVTICVRDNGSGLASDELDQIFEAFYKADQSRHELDSSGLGLSICKRIIENHGGRIWAESAGKGHGTAICFTIAAGGIQ